MGDFFISPEDLSQRLATAEPTRIFDVRRPQAIEPDSRFLPGSRWRNHLTAPEWADGLPRDTLIVLNCMHGHNVSQIATALLRETGYPARALTGGVDGWIAAGLATVGQSTLCPVDAKPGVWVTGLNPGTGPLACAWLITRFIDPDAVFHFAEPEWVVDIAEELSGVAFGLPGAGAGQRRVLCSFDTVLREFALDDPALNHLADIVRGAAADSGNAPPEHAGLTAIMQGSSMVGKADHDAMQLGFAVYDALYARLKLAGDQAPGRQPAAD